MTDMTILVFDFKKIRIGNRILKCLATNTPLAAAA